jgi:hypothetical protein
LPFGRLRYQAGAAKANANRLREVLPPFTDVVIRVYDEAGNVIETCEHKGDFCEF